MKDAYIAPGAVVVGDVVLGEEVNIWYGAVLRGDSGKITVGQGTNIQDNCVVHEETKIGAYCTVGHGAILHGCTVGDGCLIGMGAVVLDGAVVGHGSIVGAHALVTQGTILPPHSLVLGSPAKVVKQLPPETEQANIDHAKDYVRLAKEYAAR